ncbi:MAG TPA: hypothetical protein VL098_02555 [Flavipsychrobacter sp.]|nr:hypothetical protein [Flavipsychrobacter sp.]
MTTVLSLAYRIVITTVAFYAILRFKKLMSAMRIICLLIWLGLITESAGYFAAKYYGSNYVIFNIAFYLEFILIVIYYHYSIPILRKRKLGIYVALAGVVLGITNNLLLQPILTTINSNLLFIQCLMVFCLSFFSIHSMLVSDCEHLHLHRKAHFWIICILLLYESATLSSWGLYDKLGHNELEKAVMLDILLLTVNIMTYLSYGFVLFYYSKLKHDEY